MKRGYSSQPQSQAPVQRHVLRQALRPLALMLALSYGHTSAITYPTQAAPTPLATSSDAIALKRSDLTAPPPSSSSLLPEQPPPSIAQSPAQQLFEQASALIVQHYYGWVTADFTALKAQYAQKLTERCQQASKNTSLPCDYQTGRQVIEELLGEFGDGHTYLRDREWSKRLQEVNQDLAVPRTGIRVADLPEGLLVLSVMPDSPAALLGIKRFDLITSVDHKAAGKEADKAREAATPKASRLIDSAEFMRIERLAAPLLLQVERAGQSVSVQVRPALMKVRDLPSLSWQQTKSGDKVAVIDIPSFMPRGVSERFLQLVGVAKTLGAKALFVDLRYNGGGDLRQCVAASSIFGPVVYNYKQQRGESSLRAQGGQDEWDWQKSLQQSAWQGRSLVLVNEKSASCSEVFSFFAQKRGIPVMGQVTKGVGNSATTFHTLDDGSSLAVTMLKAYDEQLRPLPASITPNQQASLDLPRLRQTGQDSMMTEALSWLEQQLSAGH